MNMRPKSSQPTAPKEEPKKPQGIKDLIVNHLKTKLTSVTEAQ
jgi:hypothetical protein